MEKNENDIKEELNNVNNENENSVDDVIDKDECIKKLNEELENQKAKTDEYFDNLKRNMAEFDNYKKRVNKEREAMYKSTVADIVSELLPIVDDFEQAMQNKCEDEGFKDGMAMIKTHIDDTLKKFGLTEIESKGTFDPELHDAVMHVEDEAYGEKEIVETLRKGYKVQDKVIRHAMVKVAN